MLSRALVAKRIATKKKSSNSFGCPFDTMASKRKITALPFDVFTEHNCDFADSPTSL